jgi:hypothetical protein
MNSHNFELITKCIVIVLFATIAGFGQAAKFKLSPAYSKAAITALNEVDDTQEDCITQWKTNLRYQDTKVPTVCGLKF